MCSGLVTFEPLCVFKGWQTSGPLLICTESWGARGRVLLRTAWLIKYRISPSGTSLFQSP
jgi:hypothetical protein